MLVQGTVFSGIGGPELAAEWMGWKNAFHCEWNEFGKRVLNYYWPNAKSYHDITQTDFTIWRDKIDILTGGFPCQPYSVSGKQEGKNDERHLWPEMLRAIREIAPCYVVGENVRGLVSWNGGMVFDEVQTELENEGYEVFPCLLPAASVNAPHKRDRIFFVAYRPNPRIEGMRKQKVGCNGLQLTTDADNGIRSKYGLCSGRKMFKNGNKANGITTNPESERGNGLSEREKKESTIDGKSSRSGNVADSISVGQRGQSNRLGETRQSNQKSAINDWKNFPTQSPICDGNDGLSSRLDGITFPKWRKQSIMAGGNAIVPQVIYQIFKAIESHALSQIM